MSSDAYLDLVGLTHTEVEASRSLNVSLKSVFSGREISLRSDREHYGRRLVSIKSALVR